MKTIRFRLTTYYISLMLFLIIALIVGINLAVGHEVTHDDSPSLREDLQDERGEFGHYLAIYSAIGVGCVIVLGCIGGYFLSGIMLRPVDRVSSLAGRISYTNLKERLNYKGPNDEIKRLADTFDNMIFRLAGAVESQKQFVQDASHELRTPIATAITNIEVLEMNDKVTIEDYRKLLKILKLSLDRMNNISNSLLLLSEDTQSKSRWSKIDLISLISEIVSEFIGEAATYRVDIKWNPPANEIAVRGDAFHIRQAIINLVNNGLKYNRPGGSVSLSTYIKDGAVIIEVADTGIGIAAEDLPRIFDRFFRVDKSRSRDLGGSGLGLAIVKKIIEDHSGTVTVDSTIGRGSTFRVSLPLYRLN